MKKYLKFHEECLKTGIIPSVGLCGIFQLDKSFNLFTPDQNYIDFWESSYWAYDGRFYNVSNQYFMQNFDEVSRSYTPLRQTIVLFMAAMNGEL